MRKMSLQHWALPRLRKLLPLDEDSLEQVILYSDTLSKQAASEHLKNLLGDSAQALEFISSFNLRRPPPPSELIRPNSATSQNATLNPSEVPKSAPKNKKKKQPFNELPPPRQIDHPDVTTGAYQKKDQGDYIAGGPTKKTGSKSKDPPLSNILALKAEPDAKSFPHRSKLPPSASGPLTSDLPAPHPKARTPKPSRTSSPAPAKVTLPSGPSPRGASTTLTDLDSAIRALELQTNPTLTLSSTNTASPARRKCTCQAQRHPLLTSAPNCLSCGKIICLYEGLGPCTFCGAALLSRAQIGEMLRLLKEERGRERMAAHNKAHARPEVSRSPRLGTPGTSTPASSGGVSEVDEDGNGNGNEDEDKELARAKAQRDRLLSYQAQNAKRTTVRDEAADFETPDVGLSAWAGPAERALQLKRQQKALREVEWGSKQEWEKRRVVVSLEVGGKGGRAVRRMAEVEREEESDEVDNGNAEDRPDGGEVTSSGGGSFARNPLLGELIRPVYNRVDDKGKGREQKREEKLTWRRVQDDNDDNEQWILDGGAYGDLTDGRVLTAEEHACG